MPPLVNIGVGHNLGVEELAETVQSVIGYTGEIVFDASKPDGTPRRLDVGHRGCIAWAGRAGTEFKQGLVGHIRTSSDER